MTPKKITTPLTKEMRESLVAGDDVLLSGTIITARDSAHKRFIDALKKGKQIPLQLKDAVIYYCGPTPPLDRCSGWRPEHGRRTPASGRRPIGSCGPTTSSRMDPFTPPLLALGLGAMIGKGDRSDEVRQAIKKQKAVYFLATGGIGALLSTKVKSAKAVLYKDLGPEAVYKLEVKDFPLIVGIDAKGKDIYDQTRWKKAG